MIAIGTKALLLGGTLSLLASLAHLSCVALGAPAYRFFGAGERMARAAGSGATKPVVITIAIASVLSSWALYAFSGAGILPPLPFLKEVLALISIVYLARALGFPFLKSRFPENSNKFWLVSSVICLVLGISYATGFVAILKYGWQPY